MERGVHSLTWNQYFPSKEMVLWVYILCLRSLAVLLYLSCPWLFLIFYLEGCPGWSFVNLMQARVIRETGALIE